MSAVVLGAGLVVTACSPVKLGSAAIVGNERITIATLDTEVTNLSRTVKLYPGTVQLSQAQQTQQTLTWLIRFKINDELARRAGITVSTARGAEGAGGDLLGGQGQRAGPGDLRTSPSPSSWSPTGSRRTWPTRSAVTRPSTTSSREQVNGGQEPTSASAQSATTAKLNKARCLAAKALKVQVNPQFGQLDYNQVAVVAAPGTVARPARPGQGAFDSRG